MSAGADAKLSSSACAVVIDGRPVSDWTAAEARQAARRRILEAEALIAAAKAIEAAARLQALK